MSPEEYELREVTGLTFAHKGELRHDFLRRLINACQPGNMSDEKWLGLSQGAQQWVDSNVERLNSNLEIIDFNHATPTENFSVNNQMSSEKHDRFGLRKGDSPSLAASMFVEGCTMKEVRNATGTNHYNLLKKLRERGHKIFWQGKMIRLVHKDDVL